MRDLQHNGISFVSTICLRHFCLSLTPNIDVPPCWRGNCHFDKNFFPWISLFKILHFSNPKEIARIEKRAQGIGARPFSLVGIIYPTAAVAGLRFDIYKVNFLECLTLWLFLQKIYVYVYVKTVVYTITLPNYSQWIQPRVSFNSFERFHMHQMWIDWGAMFRTCLSPLVAQIFQSQSNSCQFVGATLIWQLLLLALQPLTSNNRKGNQALNCQNWNLPQNCDL